MQRRTALLVLAGLMGATKAVAQSGNQPAGCGPENVLTVDLGSGACTKTIRVVQGALVAQISGQELINALREDHGA